MVARSATAGPQSAAVRSLRTVPSSCQAELRQARDERTKGAAKVRNYWDDDPVMLPGVEVPDRATLIGRWHGVRGVWRPDRV